MSVQEVSFLLLYIVGQYGEYFALNNKQIHWRGFDGAENVESFTNGFVKWIDATDSAFDTIGDGEKADWVMSLEVGEHIPAEYTSQFLDTLDRHNKKGVIISWAVPEQGGHSHVNELSNEEVVRMFETRGYVQTEWTHAFQNELRGEADYAWFKDTCLVFVRALQ
jgi:2-polyprenyl-3-methyl-5-hydroxy-6-metoxy-1,4-benzoquinol methylase